MHIRTYLHTLPCTYICTVCTTYMLACKHLYTTYLQTPVLYIPTCKHLSTYMQTPVYLHANTCLYLYANTCLPTNTCMCHIHPNTCTCTIYTYMQTPIPTCKHLYLTPALPIHVPTCDTYTCMQPLVCATYMQLNPSTCSYKSCIIIIIIYRNGYSYIYYMQYLDLKFNNYYFAIVL